MALNDNNILIVKNLVKNYGINRVLDGISINIKKGETLCICGPSGTGKSTLLRCINYMEGFDSGEIIFDNDLITKKNSRFVRTHIGFVFQDFNLFPHFNVMDNVCIGPIRVLKNTKREAIENATEILEKVGLLEKAYSFPRHLSGGQKQRAAIARALAMKPKIILFDEPTSALDPETINEVLEVIKLLSKENRTLIIVTHEMQFAQDVANRICFIDKGKVVINCSKEDFFNRKKFKNERIVKFLNKISF